MRFHRLTTRVLIGLNTAILILLPLAIQAQTKVKPGMNFFSLQQDVEIGRRSAMEVERQMPISNDPRLNAHVNRVGKRLARNSSMPGLPWRFKVINSPQINAFALPGGFVYVNRGLIQATRSEDELAAVLAHEISHVTLRHGTNQLSKAMLAQMPLSVLGGILGDGGLASTLARLGISFGVNSVFLKFSRTAETQADVAGVQLMRRSGYNPQAMISFFRTLQSRHGSSHFEFFSDHPSTGSRIERISREIGYFRSRR